MMFKSHYNKLQALLRYERFFMVVKKAFLAPIATGVAPFLSVSALIWYLNLKSMF